MHDPAPHRTDANANADAAAPAAICPICGYSLAGLPQPCRCPECGTDVDRDADRRRAVRHFMRGGYLIPLRSEPPGYFRLLATPRLRCRAHRWLLALLWLPLVLAASVVAVVSQIEVSRLRPMINTMYGVTGTSGPVYVVEAAMRRDLAGGLGSLRATGPPVYAIGFRTFRPTSRYAVQCMLALPWIVLTSVGLTWLVAAVQARRVARQHADPALVRSTPLAVALSLAIMAAPAWLVWWVNLAWLVLGMLTLAGRDPADAHPMFAMTAALALVSTAFAWRRLFGQHRCEHGTLLTPRDVRLLAATYFAIPPLCLAVVLTKL